MTIRSDGESPESAKRITRPYYSRRWRPLSSIARLHLSLSIIEACIETYGSRIYFREELHNNGANRARRKEEGGGRPLSGRKEIYGVAATVRRDMRENGRNKKVIRGNCIPEIIEYVHCATVMKNARVCARIRAGTPDVRETYNQRT